MAEKAKGNVEKKKRIRDGQRSTAARLLDQVKQRLNDDSGVPDRQWTKESLQAMKEKVEALKRLDNQIIDLIGGLESEDLDAQIENEIEESDRFRRELNQIVLRLEEVLNSSVPLILATTPGAPSPNGNGQPTNPAHNVKAKLPKLEVKRFNGRLQDWQEFWDSFQSSIDRNENLSAVDKFSYLKSLVQEPARSTIAGFALTAVNYEAAVQALKKRYGKEIAIQRAHVNDLLHLPPVYSERDIPRLRKLFDECESHFRGLNALGVEESTYSTVVVPAIMQKLPENFRLMITRGQEFLTWTMERMLKAFLKELELREDHFHAMISKSVHFNKHDGRDNRMKGATANALFTQQDTGNCAFCLGKHAHENCQRVKDPKERKSIVLRFARCFKCMKKGHRDRECRVNVLCNNCGQAGHHISLCEGKIMQSLPSVTEFQILPDGQDANPIVTSSSSSSYHVGTGGRVALQTARAVIRGEGEPHRVRVLFDAGSHRSFITSKAARRSQLAVIRQDWLGISTFGQRSMDTRLRDVVEIKVSPIESQKVIPIEAYVVPEISSIQNGHVELVKGEYPHLKDLWFSDVCVGLEELEIDILVGADYLWNFQKDCTIRGGIDEPVAVETELGWVLSGPMRSYSRSPEPVQVNLVQSDDKGLDVDVHKLWDLEILGIKEPRSEVYEEYSDSISFDRNRYSVKLPWKEGHPELPTNYATSLRRLKTQVARLEREPDVLTEYATIIEEQLHAGVIERVVELEMAPKVHYLPHQAVVRKEATTTKVRIVYDASSKATKTGTSLNDCLHVGPSLNPLLFDILLRFRENRVVLVGDIMRSFEARKNIMQISWLHTECAAS